MLGLYKNGWVWEYGFHGKSKGDGLSWAKRKAPYTLLKWASPRIHKKADGVFVAVLQLKDKTISSKNVTTLATAKRELLKMCKAEGVIEND